MKIHEVDEIVRGIPFISPNRGAELYDFVHSNEITNVLELGFAHGKSTCYLAAALQAKGGGQVLTMDRPAARRREPNIETLIQRCGLQDYIQHVYCEPSFTWELMKLIEQQTINGCCQPLFDFCFLDGGHDWNTTGFAFFLVAKLLKPGGWLLFDDLRWSFDRSPTLKDSEKVRRMADDYRSTRQVMKVFDLLVSQHPGFTNLRVDGNWGWAQMKAG